MSEPEDQATSIPASAVDISELGQLEGAHQVPVTASGNEYRCPACENPIPTRKQIRLSKPAKYEGALNDIFKCPTCNFLFSPRNIATVLRQ